MRGTRVLYGSGVPTAAARRLTRRTRRTGALKHTECCLCSVGAFAARVSRCYAHFSANGEREVELKSVGSKSHPTHTFICKCTTNVRAPPLGRARAHSLLSTHTHTLLTTRALTDSTCNYRITSISSSASTRRVIAYVLWRVHSFNKHTHTHALCHSRALAALARM